MRFLDLEKQWAPLQKKILSEVEADMKTGRFVGGPRIERLEEALCDYTGFKHCVCVSSGTMALLCACKHLARHTTGGWQIPDLTFHATAFAALEAGIDVSVMPATKPEAACLVDIPYATPTIPVDLYGTPTDWLAETIYPLLIDSCQSLGAEVQGKRVGETNVWAAAYSFYPGKNLASMGEGGALLTNDGHLAEYARAYINQGQLRKGKHDILGTNGRMHALQAIPIYWGLQHLEEWNSRRRHVALSYDAVIDEVSGVMRIARRLQIPSDRLPTRHIYPIFAIQTRALIADALKAAGVPCAWHYPEQLSASQCFTGTDVDFGAPANYVGSPFQSEISLPCHPFITDSDVQVVREALLGVATRVAGGC